MLDPLSLAQALIRCPSVTPNDAGALAVLEQALEPLGFTCHRLVFEDGAPRTENLYAQIGTGAPRFCFAGHTDVVPPGDTKLWRHDPFGAVVENGVLYGRGAIDMKGAVAAFVAATARYLAKGQKGSIALLITGDEEGDAINGTPKMLKWLKAKAIKLDHCIVGEPSSLVTVGDTLKVGRRGSLNMAVKVAGSQGHVAYPAKALNPIPALAGLVNRLSNLTLDGGSALFDPSTLAFTSVDVGNPATNVIPAEARANFNVRFSDCHTPETLLDLLNKAAEAVAKDSGCTITMEPSLSGVAFSLKPGAFTELVAKAVASVTGKPPVSSTSGGTSDARFIKELCPVAELGLVNATMHQTDECVPVADLETLTGIYTALLETYFATP